MTYYNKIEINLIIYIVSDNHSNPNSVLFSIELDEYLPDTILVRIDYSDSIAFQSYEPLTINLIAITDSDYV
jgi:hypothetical protein